MKEFANHISREDLEKIFSSNFDRSFFIWEYKNFLVDDNAEFYKAFIKENIGGDNSKKQEDALELTIQTGLYTASDLEIIEKILHSRKNGDLKLVCMDWLYIFFEQIPLSELIRVNQFALKNKNDLVKAQAIINLLLVLGDDAMLDLLENHIINTEIPAVCYRVYNAIRNGKLAQYKERIVKAIQLNPALTDGQKAELA